MLSIGRALRNLETKVYRVILSYLCTVRNKRSRIHHICQTQSPGERERKTFVTYCIYLERSMGQVKLGKRRQNHLFFKTMNVNQNGMRHFA